MENLVQLVWPMHVASTCFMVGLIWFVQVVHYPLFAAVGKNEFTHYEELHQRLTTWVVAPAMLIELSTGAVLPWVLQGGKSTLTIWASLGCLLLIWLSTAFVQVPCHRLLSTGFDAKVHRKLVVSNWLRTIAWTLRAGLILSVA